MSNHTPLFLVAYLCPTTNIVVRDGLHNILGCCPACGNDNPHSYLYEGGNHLKKIVGQWSFYDDVSKKKSYGLLGWWLAGLLDSRPLRYVFVTPTGEYEHTIYERGIL